MYDIDDPLASIYSVTGPPTQQMIGFGCTHVKTKHPLPNLWPFTFLLAGKIVSWQKRENSQQHSLYFRQKHEKNDIRITNISVSRSLNWLLNMYIIYMRCIDTILFYIQSKPNCTQKKWPENSHHLPFVPFTAFSSFVMKSKRSLLSRWKSLSSLWSPHCGFGNAAFPPKSPEISSLEINADLPSLYVMQISINNHKHMIT